MAAWWGRGLRGARGEEAKGEAGQRARLARPNSGRWRLHMRGLSGSERDPGSPPFAAGTGGLREPGSERRDRKFRTAIEPLFLLIPSGPAAQLRH